MKVGLTKGNLTTATTQSISYDSALGDAEAFVLFISSHTTTGTVEDGSGLLIWMSDGTNEHSAYSWHFGATGNNHDRGRNSKGYFAENGTVRLDGTSSINTGTDAIDLVFTSGTAPTSTFEYCLVTFHGADVNALCVSHDGTDQTESIGFDWDFLVTTGASTTSTTSASAAMNWGVCDKNGNQGVARHGIGDGTSITFSIFRNDCINTNIFNTSQFETLTVDTITTNGFNLNCSVASNNDEPGVYLAIGCNNDVEVVTNQTLTASTGDENVTVSHATEYALFGGVVGPDAVNTIEYSSGGGDPTFFVGACDLSAGADTSGDYFALGFGGYTNAFESVLTHSGCIAGTTGTGGSSVLADISSVGSPSPTVVGKATAGTTTRMWFLNIGPDSGGTTTSKTVTDYADGYTNVDRTLDYARTVTDFASGYTSVSRTVSLTRTVQSFADGYTVVARTLAYSRTVQDFADGYTAVTGTQSNVTSKTVQDFASGYTAVSRTLSLVRTVEDFADGYTAVGRTLAFSRTIEDFATGYTNVIDNLQEAGVTSKTVQDFAAGYTNVTRTVAYARTVQDFADGYASVARTIAYSRTVQDFAEGYTSVVDNPPAGDVTLSSISKKIDVILAILLSR